MDWLSEFITAGKENYIMKKMIISIISIYFLILYSSGIFAFDCDKGGAVYEGKSYCLCYQYNSKHKCGQQKDTDIPARSFWVRSKYTAFSACYALCHNVNSHPTTCNDVNNLLGPENKKCVMEVK